MQTVSQNKLLNPVHNTTDQAKANSTEKSQQLETETDNTKGSPVPSTSGAGAHLQKQLVAQLKGAQSDETGQVTESQIEEDADDKMDEHKIQQEILKKTKQLTELEENLRMMDQFKANKEDADQAMRQRERQYMLRELQNITSVLHALLDMMNKIAKKNLDKIGHH